MQHQLFLISTGENGISSRCTLIMSGLNAWKIRLMERLNEMDEIEWLKFVDQFYDYSKTCLDIQAFLGSIAGLEDPSMSDIPILETVSKGSRSFGFKFSFFDF